LPLCGEEMTEGSGNPNDSACIFFQPLEELEVLFPILGKKRRPPAPQVPKVGKTDGMKIYDQTPCSSRSWALSSISILSKMRYEQI